MCKFLRRIKPRLSYYQKRAEKFEQELTFSIPIEKEFKRTGKKGKKLIQKSYPED